MILEVFFPLVVEDVIMMLFTRIDCTFLNRSFQYVFISMIRYQVCSVDFRGEHGFYQHIADISPIFLNPNYMFSVLEPFDGCCELLGPCEVHPIIEVSLSCEGAIPRVEGI